MRRRVDVILPDTLAWKLKKKQAEFALLDSEVDKLHVSADI